MLFIIRGEFFRQTSRLLAPSLFHQKLYGMSFLSAVSGSPGVYILEKPDDLAISEQWHSRKKISIINTPQAILLVMFILHTFMGALSKSKMC